MRLSAIGESKLRMTLRRKNRLLSRSRRATTQTVPNFWQKLRYNQPKLMLDLTKLSDMVSHAYASSDGSESISSICTRRSVKACVDNSRDFFKALFMNGSEAPVSEATSRVSADQALLAAAASNSSPELVEAGACDG